MTGTTETPGKTPNSQFGHEDSLSVVADPATLTTGRLSQTTPHGLFVTGTDTGVGKTHVTCLIVRQLLAAGVRVAAYKPACSGAVVTHDVLSLDEQAPASINRVDASRWSRESSTSVLGSQSIIPRWDDIDRLYKATSRIWSKDTICPQRFIAPLAPPVAARLEGRSVDTRLLVDGAYRFSNADVLIIEGAGGWLSPLADETTVADLAVELNAPVLIVARAGLGTINHTLLTIEAVRSRGLVVAGVILNEVIPPGGDLSCLTNGGEIVLRGKVPVLGTVRHGNDIELQQNDDPVTIDWRELMHPIAERGGA